MRPFLLGLALLLHALAQTAVGSWAAGAMNPWIVMPLWLVAMCGFMAAAFAVWGVESLGRYAAPLASFAAIASMLVQWRGGLSVLAGAGILLSVVLAMLVRWWARCAHPEIHTPTMVTSEMPVVTRDRPNYWQHLWHGGAWVILTWTALLVALRPWHQTWGSTLGERAESIPGVALDARTRYRVDHGITVHAPADSVWPWVAQMGQDRAGFYSYDWLERAFGDHIANSDSLVPQWQRRAVGELVRATQPDYLNGRFGRDLGWKITHWNPPHEMVLAQWGAFRVRAIDDSTSRVLVQARGPGDYSFRMLFISPLSFYFVEPAHFIMERGMLLGIKARAERKVASRD